MKTKIKKGLLIGLTLITCHLSFSVALTSCSSDEDFYYSDEARVRLEGDYLWAVGSDSVTFSFVAYSDDVQEQTIDVDAKIMGLPENRDRTVNITVDASKTTAPASLYTIPEQVVIPSGKTKGTFSVVLKRAAELQQKTVRLYLKVSSSADFKPGVSEQDHITFIWNDILSKPTNWPDLETFFGTYSDTKYRFMLANSNGVGEFSADTMSWAMLNNLRIRFQNALNDYNATHPGQPLTDENGQLVSF